jgi:hypothetical protein
VILVDLFAAPQEQPQAKGKPILEPPAPKPRGRRRVNLAVAVNAGDHFSVLTVQPFAEESPPDGDRLAGWVAAGWQLSRLPHGNIGGGGTLEMQKGIPVTLAQALLGIEVDGKHFRVTARDVLTATVEEPDDWKTLQGWTSDGWSLSDCTGNLQHGSFVVMQKPLDDVDDGK